MFSKSSFFGGPQNCLWTSAALPSLSPFLYLRLLFSVACPLLLVYWRSLSARSIIEVLINVASFSAMAFTFPTPVVASASARGSPSFCPRRRKPSVRLVPFRQPLAMTYSSPSSPYAPNGSGNSLDPTPSDVESEAVDARVSTLDAETRPVPLSEMKCSLYAAVGATNRGLSASSAMREQILSLIAELERALPPSAPADDPAMLCGRWRLLFTDAPDVLSLGLLAPVAQVGQIFQNIYEAPPGRQRDYDFDVQNVVELEPVFAPLANAFIGQTMSSITVSAEGKRTSESRVDITFVQTAIRPETFVGLRVPQELPAATFGIGSPVGYIETTFLDADVRVARAPPSTGKKDGNVFVLIREQ